MSDQKSTNITWHGGAVTVFQPEAVASLMDRHLGGEDHGERIWNLLALETWYREIVDGRAALVADWTAREATATEPVKGHGTAIAA